MKSVAGLDWPIGYGAEMPLDMLGVARIPDADPVRQIGHERLGRARLRRPGRSGGRGAGGAARVAERFADSSGYARSMRQ